MHESRAADVDVDLDAEQPSPLSVALLLTFTYGDRLHFHPSPAAWWPVFV